MSKQRNEVESYTRNRGFSYRADFAGGDNITYEGWSEANVKTSDAGWQIIYHQYDASNRLISSDWAQTTNAGGIKLASDDFVQIWDNRASLDYGAV